MIGIFFCCQGRETAKLKMMLQALERQIHYPLLETGKGGGGVPIPEVTPPFRRCRPCTVEVPAYPIFLLSE
jgi:hypothetical protein